MGTDTAVMELVRKLFSDINENDESSVLFLDYSRAFNTVNHSILLRKMNMYGFANDVCKWFGNYFENRTQYTKLGTVLSSGVSTKHGVYQGSPLGPLFFIIYINDIVRLTEMSFCNMYADDTVVVSSNNDINLAVRDSMLLFDTMSNWCKANRIKVNAKKTKHMLIAPDKKVGSLDTTVFVQEIATVKNLTYLGVNLDNKLTFEKFLNGTISRVNARLITLARIRKNLDTKTALLIYKQTILPILDYMCIVVNSCTQAKIKILQPLQNRAVKIVEKRTGYISTDDMKNLHVKLKPVMLEERRKMFML